MASTRYGRYETLQRIAAGGMASVYLGRAVGAGGFERLVAIKVMHEHIAADDSFSAMFLDEARIAARIRHPNVVPTLDVADDGAFIVMEYVEGASLKAILSHRRKAGDATLPLPIALRVFLDVLAGLHAAHELSDAQGKPLRLVHRDVSPHNVLVGVDGMARITDFGIAYAEARITSTKSGQLKGKLPYMAPEQLEDAEVTRRTDVYAAGCVLWEMLAGRRLFKGTSEAAVACAILAGPDVSLRQLRPEVPTAIDEACMRALGRHDDRYASALEFAEALEAAAEAAGVMIAKHRMVGSVAQLPQMTFPPVSTLTDPEEDPRPPELVRQFAEAQRAAPVSARTTTEDVPPPEVAAVIREAYEREVAERSRPPSEERTDLSAAVGARAIPPKSRAPLWVAVVAALGLGGTIAWVTLRTAPASTTAETAPVASAASASGSARPTPPRVATSAPSPAPSQSAVAPPPAAPPPSLRPPTIARPVPSPAPLPAPLPASSEYHPDRP
jgi:serine/threonine protein kinase